MLKRGKETIRYNKDIKQHDPVRRLPCIINSYGSEQEGKILKSSKSTYFVTRSTEVGKHTGHIRVREI